MVSIRFLTLAAAIVMAVTSVPVAPGVDVDSAAANAQREVQLEQEMKECMDNLTLDVANGQGDGHQCQCTCDLAGDCTCSCQTSDIVDAGALTHDDQADNDHMQHCLEQLELGPAGEGDRSKRAACGYVWRCWRYNCVYFTYRGRLYRYCRIYCKKFPTCK